MPASKGEIMKRPITLAVLSALVLSSAVAIQVTAASGESKDTQCWDVYNLRGTRKISTIAPKGLSTGDCTPAVGCYYTYRASDDLRTKWVVPYGMTPKNVCGPDGSAPTTAVTTTAVPTTAVTTTAVTTTAVPTTAVPTTAVPTTAVATTAAPTTAVTTTAAPGVLSTSAAASPSQVAQGASVRLSATMRSDIGRSALVDLEVYSSSGQKVFQFWWDNQAFRAGESKTLSTDWSIPSSLVGWHVHLEDRRVRCRLEWLGRVERRGRHRDGGFRNDDDIVAAVAPAAVVGEVCDVAGGCGVAVGCGVCDPGEAGSGGSSGEQCGEQQRGQSCECEHSW